MTQTKDVVAERIRISNEEQIRLANGFDEASERTKRMKDDYDVFLPKKSEEWRCYLWR